MVKRVIKSPLKEGSIPQEDVAAAVKKIKGQRTSNLKYPVVMVYAIDWNQYSAQHSPTTGEPYHAAKGWIVGFLIEETDEHLVLAHTSFDPGDVRYAVVVPKCTIIQRKVLKGR